MAAPSHPWSVGLDGDGRDLLAKVGVRVGRLPIYKHVQLTLGNLPAVLPTDRVMLPVSWETVGGPVGRPKGVQLGKATPVRTDLPGRLTDV